MTIVVLAHKLGIRRGADRTATFTAAQAILLGRGPTGSVYVRSAKDGLKNGRTVS
jgi:hypothetical protein